jgi:two-component system NtrC family sensor kinase
LVSADTAARVLIVDDEPTVARALQRALGRRHAVDIAADARAGLDLIVASPYDVVLCDMLMPEMDGMTFANELSQHDPAMLKRLVMMSGSVPNGQVITVADGRELRIIGKPFELVEVMAVVDDVIASN